MNKIITLILITLLPFLELRASIPIGILTQDITLPLGFVIPGFGMNYIQVFLICVIANILLAFVVWFFVNYIMHIFLKIKFIKKIYDKLVIRTQKKVHPYVEKYGTIGLALFIGVPLPGSGVYSGALAAYLLGFDFKDYIKAASIGVLIAGTIVLLVSLFGNGIFVKLFLKV